MVRFEAVSRGFPAIPATRPYTSHGHSQQKMLGSWTYKGSRIRETGMLDVQTHFKPINTFHYLHFSSHPKGVFVDPLLSTVPYSLSSDLQPL